MPLVIGARLGPYEILSPLGAGGMGEVYRARDTKLNRTVALKVLPSEFALDADRLARFKREAMVLASLDHPNIGAIYGFEESDDLHALVLQLVEGPTLADRIAQGPIPVDEALPIVRQIAEALEAAHDKGVIHRDLKPANVKVTADGQVKVLDFGLAKLLDPAVSGQAPTYSSGLTNSPTITTPAMTLAGVILGTAAYMSPEQARGHLVDKRADIWAFGVVLYEMLTGIRLFQGDSVSDTLAAVLRAEPDLNVLPTASRRLIQSCLEKDPKRRLRDIGDAGRLLEQSETIAYRQSKTAWLVAAALGIATAVALGAPWRAARSSPDVMRLQINLPENVTLSPASPFSIAPDGRKLAFVATGPDRASRIWVRHLDSLEARSIAGSEVAATIPPPFWSPDSRFLAFSAFGKLKTIDINGGPAQTLFDLPQVSPGGSWNRDSVIIFPVAPQGIMRISAQGGAAVAVTRVDVSRQENTHSYPWFLPDGRHFLYLRSSRKAENVGIYLGSLDANPEEQSRQKLVASSLGAAYASSSVRGAGYVLFRREAALVAQGFDENSLRLTGEPVVAAEQLGAYFGFGLFSASANGVLAYRTGDVAQSSRLVMLDGQGKPVGTISESGAYTSVAISPDGTRAAVRRTDYQTARTQGLWLVDFSRDSSTRFTFGAGLDEAPVWSPDGSRIVFASSRNGVSDLYRKPANGATDEELLFASREPKLPLSWSSDGRFLLFRVDSRVDASSANHDLWVLPLEGSHKPIPYLRTEFDESDGSFSPDGHWVAYVSNESGREEVYVRAFTPDLGGDSAASGGKSMVSQGGGSRPRWRADSRELFYISPDRNMIAVPVLLNPGFQPGARRVVFQIPPGTVQVDTNGNGRRVAIVPVERTAQGPFTLVLNWQAGLKK
jgi:eukaryotic-like serine/threonine-protein kinase